MGAAVPAAINAALDQHFPTSGKHTIIGEPGRYMVQDAATIACAINGVRPRRSPVGPYLADLRAAAAEIGCNPYTAQACRQDISFVGVESTIVCTHWPSRGTALQDASHPGISWLPFHRHCDSFLQDGGEHRDYWISDGLYGAFNSIQVAADMVTYPTGGDSAVHSPNVTWHAHET